MASPRNEPFPRASRRFAAACCAALLLGVAAHAAPNPAPGGDRRTPQGASQPSGTDDPALRPLKDAAAAVVAIRMRALADARSRESLGEGRSGSGVLIAPSGLVLTIGYLVLEADEVEVTDSTGRTLPATVVAYDHATGFGLLRPFGRLTPKPVALGDSGALATAERVLVVTAGDEGGASVAAVVSRRPFAGYWEYLIEGAIFTAPPRLDHSGAALFNRSGELVGIGSLLVMDAVTPGERMPGNMFVPVDLLKPVLAEMIETGRQKGGRRPWIGLSAVEDEGRLKVVRVTADGPAEKAGVKPGDIILSVTGEKVKSLDGFYRRLWSAGAPGIEVPFTLLQGNDVRELRIRSIDRLDFVRRKPTI